MNEQRKINVLIVDDDPVAAEAARSGSALFVDDKRIMTASDSVEMMRILTTTPIDLAFLDMEMPDTDGFTVADYLVKVQPKAKYA
ncbi:MAG: response regulator, partial [Clostridia bacterium]|nr:response regulator [Clostridia bacterium]